MFFTGDVLGYNCIRRVAVEAITQVRIIAVTLILIPAAFIASVTRREEINATATSTITTTTALLLLTQHDIG